MKELIYVSGKIKGLDPEIALLKFEIGSQECIALGFDILNPMKLPHQHDKTWESYMAEDTYYLLKCQAIYMLDNWSTSRGARIEYAIAREMGLRVIFQEAQQHHERVVVKLEQAVIRQRNHNVGEVTDTDF